jgi:tetratricopeptide (TPR) repeat protein
MADSASSEAERLAQLLQAGIAAAKAGQAGEARRALLGALRLDRRSEQAWLWLSSVVQLADQRRSCLQAALRVNPDNPHARSGLAVLAQQSGGPEHSSEACPRCNTALPQTGTACPACGLLILVTCPACGQFAEATNVACPECGAPIGDFNDGVEYHLDLARAYVEHGRLQLAAMATQLAAAAAPGDLVVMREVAAVREALGDTDGAIAVWQRVIDADPNNAEACSRLGAIYRRRSMPAQAQQMYRLAAERSEGDPEALYQLSQLWYEESGATSQVLELLQRAVAQDPDHAAAHALLADVCAELGRERTAAEHYEHAASRAPSGSLLARDSKRKLERLRPRVDERKSQGGWETLRHMGGLVLIPALAALANAGLSPAQISALSWAMLALATAGSFLFVCASDVHRHPLMRKVFGEPGLARGWQKAAVGVPGAATWLGALAAILARA